MSALLDQAEAICTLLRGYRFACTSEAQLQEAIATVLSDAGYHVVREKHLSRKDRPDFDVDGIAIEVKDDGSLTEVVRQLFRYAEQPAVKVLVLVTTRSKHTQVPDTICGKPTRLVHIIGALA